MHRSSDDASESAQMLRYAAGHTLRYLETSQSWEKLALAEGEFHAGDDPIQADRAAQLTFEKAIEMFPGSVSSSVIAVVGEERIRRTPGEPASGTRLIVVDPLDGSTQWSMVGAAFCVAAFCLVATDSHRWQIESAVVANPQHCFSWQRGREGMGFGSIRQSVGVDVNSQSVVSETGLTSPSLAFTGFKVSDRTAMIGIAEALPEWHMFTTGGNAATPYVASAGLTATLALRPQASWDAIATFIASKTDAVVGDLDGTVLDGDTFHHLFERVVVTGNVRRVPALVVAKSKKRYDEVIERLQPMVEEGLIAPPVPPMAHG